MTVSMKTVSGDLSCALPATTTEGGKRNRTLAVNGGGVPVQVKSVSGDCTIRAAGAATCPLPRPRRTSPRAHPRRRNRPPRPRGRHAAHARRRRTDTTHAGGRLLRNPLRSPGGRARRTDDRRGDGKTRHPRRRPAHTRPPPESGSGADSLGKDLLGLCLMPAIRPTDRRNLREMPGDTASLSLVEGCPDCPQPEGEDALPRVAGLRRRAPDRAVGEAAQGGAPLRRPRAEHEQAGPGHRQQQTAHGGPGLAPDSAPTPSRASCPPESPARSRSGGYTTQRLPPGGQIGDHHQRLPLPARPRGDETDLPPARRLQHRPVPFHC